MNRKKFIIITAMACAFGLASCGGNSSNTPHVHDYIFVNGTAPTCVDEGTASYYKCSGCNKIFNEDKEEITASDLTINALGHTYGTMIPAQEPTCTEEGMEAHYQCSICHEYFDAEKNPTTIDDLKIDPTGHVYVPVEEVPSDCLHHGIAAHYTCENCDCIFDADKNVTDMESLTLPLGSHDLIHHDSIDASYETTGQIEYWECSVCHKQFSDAQGTVEPDTIVIPKLTRWSNKHINSDNDIVITEKNEYTEISNSKVGNGRVFLHMAKEGPLTYFRSTATFEVPSYRVDVGLGVYWKGMDNGASKDLTAFACIDDMYGANANALLSDFWVDGSRNWDVPGYNPDKRLQMPEADFLSKTNPYADGYELGDTNNRPVTYTVTMEKTRYSLNFYLGSGLIYSEPFSHFSSIYSLEADQAVEPVVAYRNHNCTEERTVKIMNQGVQELTLAESYGATKVEAQDFACCTIASYYYDEVSGKYFNAEGAEEVTYESLITLKGDSHNLEHHDAKTANCGQTGNLEYSICKDCGMVFDANGHVTSLDNVLLPISGNHSLTHHAEQQADYENNGVAEHYECDICGNKYREEAAITKVSDEELLLPKLTRFDSEKIFQTNYTYTENNGGVDATYNSNGADILCLPLNQGTKTTFKISSKYIVTQNRMDFGLGMMWYAGSTRYTLMLTLDSLNEGSNFFFTDGYVDGHSKFNLNTIGSRTTILAADLPNYADGITDGGSRDADNLDFTFKISFVKDSDGIKLMIGSKVQLSFTYDALNATYGENFITESLAVTPCIAVRGHSPKRSPAITNFQIRDIALTNIA